MSSSYPLLQTIYARAPVMSSSSLVRASDQNSEDPATEYRFESWLDLNVFLHHQHLITSFTTLVMLREVPSPSQHLLPELELADSPLLLSQLPTKTLVVRSIAGQTLAWEDMLRSRSSAERVWPTRHDETRCPLRSLAARDRENLLVNFDLKPILAHPKRAHHN